MAEPEEASPPGEDWPATRQAMFDRMDEERISVAQLAAITGQSENTIRNLGRQITRSNKSVRSNKSTLTLISLGLRWKHDHLWNILHGEPHKNSESALETRFAETLRQTREFDALRSAITTLHDSIHEVDGRIKEITEPDADPEDGTRQHES